MYLNKTDVTIMAICTGLIVANLYYCQPLIPLIAKEYHILPGTAGSLNYIIQAGYAAGLLFLVPVGDLVERKKQILVINGLVVLSLIAAAVAPTFLFLQVASFFIGFNTIVPQLILPLGAHLAEPSRRGKVIGSIMSGLLFGILLSRTASGFLGNYLGWRAVYWTAAFVCLVLMAIIAVRFPSSNPHFKGTYGKLMRSLITLLPHAALQEACMLSALAFGTFGAFWTTMVLYLSGEPFHYNSLQIGLFGLVGAAGALGAPITGRLGDKGNPRNTIAIGLSLILGSFIAFYLFSNALAGFILGVVMLDFGVQAVHVSNQTRVYALIPEARNRLNTIYMSITFTGTALGSALGLFLWKVGGWPTFCMGGASLMICAFLVYALYHKKLTPQKAVA